MEHKAKALTEAEVMEGRSSAYDFIDFDKRKAMESITPEIVGKPKKLKEVIMYIVSYPILEIGTGSVHVHKEKFFFETQKHLIAQVGRFITDLEAKDEKGVLMISAINERKFLGIQEQIARINNAEAKEQGQTQYEGK